MTLLQPSVSAGQMPSPRVGAPSRPVPATGAAEAVFVDLTGRRGRWVTVFGIVLAALLIAYLVAVVTAVLVADPVPDGALPPAASSPGQPATGLLAGADGCQRVRCAGS